MDEDLVIFAHGITSAVAATTVWEVMRAALDGTALLVVGGIASGVILHLIHRHHARVMARRRPRGHHPRRLPRVTRRVPRDLP